MRARTESSREKSLRALYDGHASVLIRLDRIELPELEEAIAEAWMARAPTRLLAAYREEHEAGC